MAPDYKNKSSLRADDLRRRREEQQVEIRRQKREENVTKRRNLDLAEGPESDDEGSNGVSVLNGDFVPPLIVNAVATRNRPLPH